VVSLRSVHSWEEHGELVDAIASRDPQRAADVMRKHIDHTRAAYHEHLSRDVSDSPVRAVPDTQEPVPADEAAS
jgi:DNA-binding GntR family transcriptional regulator